MKKVIRLTESDLARIVKRVIKESKGILNEGVGAKAFQIIKQGLSKMNTDEDMIAKGVYMIKTKVDYQECLALVKKAGYNTIISWINTKWQEVDPGSDFAALVGASTTKQLGDLVRHLGQFNTNESQRSGFNLADRGITNIKRK
jgi:hypothetical protein